MAGHRAVVRVRTGLQVGDVDGRDAAVLHDVAVLVDTVALERDVVTGPLGVHRLDHDVPGRGGRGGLREGKPAACDVDLDDLTAGGRSAPAAGGSSAARTTAAAGTGEHCDDRSPDDPTAPDDAVCVGHKAKDVSNPPPPRRHPRSLREWSSVSRTLVAYACTACGHHAP